MNEENKNNVVVFLDYVGRTILGEKVENKNENLICVKNPVILHVVPVDQGGRMSIQLLPLFFREFLAEKTGDVVFNYNKNTIVETDIEALDFRLLAQYSQLFNKNNIFVPPNAGNIITPDQTASAQPSPGVVKLFDE
jgi:hypothetical protein